MPFSNQFSSYESTMILIKPQPMTLASTVALARVAGGARYSHSFVDLDTLLVL